MSKLLQIITTVFFYVNIKWSGSVHDARIFSYSKLNKMLKDAEIPHCSKVIIEGESLVPICLLGHPAYTFTIYHERISEWGKNAGKKGLFCCRLSSARMVILCAFGRLKARFGCLRRDMDISLDDLPFLYLLILFCLTSAKLIKNKLIDSMLLTN